jgi:imidazolonepropionase-like amidohydrolase
MRRLFITLLMTMMLATASIQFAQQAIPVPSGSFAIEHVTVINVETATRTPDQTVVVTGNKIAAVGPSAKTKAPAGARIVDGTAKFLIPGIWDTHVHALRLMDRGLPLAVYYGITGIRDMGSTIEQVGEARARVGKGEILSPRMYLAGPPLNGTPNRPGFPPGQQVQTPDEGRQIVEKLADAKVNMVKVHDGLSRETYFAIAAAAKAKGLPFEGHLPPEVDFNEASDTGQRTVEHMPPLQDACARDIAQLGRGQRGGPTRTEPIDIDQAKCEATIKHIVKNGTWWAPSIGGPGAGNKRVREFNLKITNMAYKGGVKILAGTDWPGGGYSFGNYSGADRSVLDELVGLAEAGLTPQDVLKTTITNPVALFKLKDQLGTVERGKLADLDLLDGDPLADISNIKKISAVVVNGRLVDAAERQKIIDAEMAARKLPVKNSN